MRDKREMMTFSVEEMDISNCFESLMSRNAMDGGVQKFLTFCVCLYYFSSKAIVELRFLYLPKCRR